MVSVWYFFVHCLSYKRLNVLQLNLCNAWMARHENENIVFFNTHTDTLKNTEEDIISIVQFRKWVKSSKYSELKNPKVVKNVLLWKCKKFNSGGKTIRPLEGNRNYVVTTFLGQQFIWGHRFHCWLLFLHFLVNNDKTTTTMRYMKQQYTWSISMIKWKEKTTRFELRRSSDLPLLASVRCINN